VCLTGSADAIFSLWQALETLFHDTSERELTHLKIVLVISAKAVYNVYLHPLRWYPGSKLWALSPVPIALAQLTGTFHEFTHAAHQRYGAVVRIGPNELSFISAAAWGDIYNRREGKPPLPRDKAFFNAMLVDANTLTMADDHNHARLRRAMNPAFAPRALATQEPILQKNVDLFLKKLELLASDPLPIDLRHWFNYITFDMLGDLAFGESFGCLGTATYNAWVGVVLDNFYTATLLHVVHRFRPLNALLARIIPSSLVEKKQWHERKALETVRKRIQKSNDRPDFMQPLIQAREQGIVSADELEQQASILILAGSETTAVALTSATYLLLDHPAAMARLADEVRANYRDESEIGSLSIHKLHFLHAVIQESLRLFPPITNGFPREVGAGQGAIIDGRLVPSGVSVMDQRARSSI
jgi:cytochrome P450